MNYSDIKEKLGDLFEEYSIKKSYILSRKYMERDIDLIRLDRTYGLMSNEESYLRIAILKPQGAG